MIYLLADFREIVIHEGTTTIDSAIKYFESRIYLHNKRSI